ncbi:MAG: hypothetical protein ACT4NX_00775 [Deltaproteobacteria bacterium]
MSKSLNNYERDFRKSIEELPDKKSAGNLLSVIPNHADWDDFLTTVKADWRTWRSNLGLYPNCLVVIYGGLAFHEYDENTFWPQFARAIGTEPLPSSQQSEINSAFSNAAQNLGLKILKRKSDTDYVGSAVYHIGIPLSLWDGFLEICEWALWKEDWKKLTDEQWTEAVGKRAGGRVRLKRFLTDNREATTEFVQAMIDARVKLSNDQSLKISDIAQASLLRPEYLEEVPETAEFLRPQNPDSLFQDRARLVWNDQKSRISLSLPGVARDKLPATWSIGERTQKAASTPDEMILNSAAFDDLLSLKLESGGKSETQRLRGIKPWGLFDLERDGCVVNPKREHLPLSRYVLISPEKFDNISRRGFDEEGYQTNEPYELGDGTNCFVTRLYPTGKHASLSLTHGSETLKLDFRPSAKIEARFFIGEGVNAAKFARAEGSVKTERLPLLCVAVPNGYFGNTPAIAIVRKKFQVFVDAMPACGNWEKRHNCDDREFYIWRWAKTPVIDDKGQTSLVRGRGIKGLGDIQFPDIIGKRTISIKAPERGIKFEHKVEILKPQPDLDKCFNNLPGAFLLWFLLEQSNEGMKWEDLLLAKEIIAPTSPKISSPLLSKYAKCGLIQKKGQLWQIAESRACVLERMESGDWNMKFCGKPSALWGLIKDLHEFNQRRKQEMQRHRKIYVDPKRVPTFNPQNLVVEVVNNYPEPPYLCIKYRENQKDRVMDYLKKNDIHIVSNLWEGLNGIADSSFSRRGF